MKGFKFAGIHAGIKKNTSKDLGLIYCDQPAVAAALFTRNKVVAAPVILGKQKIKKGLCQAVLVNSGNANCFTGEQGMDDAVSCSKMLGTHLGISDDLVMVSSTGVIGAPMPMDKFETGIPEAIDHLTESNLHDFADAILTTDTNRKVIVEKVVFDGHEFCITGVVKGSGMIRPDMATMLAYILTDADIDVSDLSSMLKSSNEKSFNRISVDGDTSTNDTLLALANGSSGVKIDSSDAKNIFQKTLDKICLKLAKMVVKDGEGATKLIQINVKGAKTKTDAFKACETIAHSNLVKTAVYGEDPNWGRITAAAGRSGAQVEPEKMDLYFGEVQLVKKGVWLGADVEKKAAVVMKDSEITFTLDLNIGNESDYFLFCDFSENYVKINADYRS